MAKNLGASRLIGSVGGPDKAKRLVDEFGYDAAIDYRVGDIAGQLASAAPDGINVYFDNVGGDHLRAAIADGLARTGARAVTEAGNVLEPHDVADQVVKGVEDERFLILPHPQVLEFFRRKASDYDRWISGMRRYQEAVS